MGLLDQLIHRDRAGATPARAEASVMSGEQAQAARVRARRRLIGAVVLLGVGVIAFPLLFETQPRPIAVDIPIVIPPREGAPPLALPAPRPAATAAPAASAPLVAPAPVAAVPSPAPAPAPKPVEPAPVAKPAVAAAPASKPVVEDKPKPVVQDKPKPVAEAPKAAAVPPPAAAGRFVVQIGAFAEASAVRDVRSKAQKAGVSTFTQVVETSDGKRTRVRVGPFASREEAEKAAAQVKAAGLPGSVMAL
jgi:DedD protein